MPKRSDDDLKDAAHLIGVKYGDKAYQQFCVQENIEMNDKMRLCFLAAFISGGHTALTIINEHDKSFIES